MLFLMLIHSKTREQPDRDKKATLHHIRKLTDVFKGTWRNWDPEVLWSHITSAEQKQSTVLPFMTSYDGI